MKAPDPKRKGQHRWKGELAKPLSVGVALANTDLKKAGQKQGRHKRGPKQSPSAGNPEEPHREASPSDGAL
jgi:hypothetical protein